MKDGGCRWRRVREQWHRHLHYAEHVCQQQRHQRRGGVFGGTSPLLIPWTPHCHFPDGFVRNRHARNWHPLASNLPPLRMLSWRSDHHLQEWWNPTQVGGGWIRMYGLMPMEQTTHLQACFVAILSEKSQMQRCTSATMVQNSFEQNSASKSGGAVFQLQCPGWRSPIADAKP